MEVRTLMKLTQRHRGGLIAGIVAFLLLIATTQVVYPLTSTPAAPEETAPTLTETLTPTEAQDPAVLRLSGAGSHSFRADDSHRAGSRAVEALAGLGVAFVLVLAIPRLVMRRGERQTPPRYPRAGLAARLRA
jgi:hypothetical protein